jgi:hypothetical protein
MKIKYIVMKCIEENCNTRGTFNYLNEIKPIYCEIHKKIGMMILIKLFLKVFKSDFYMYESFYLQIH